MMKPVQRSEPSRFWAPNLSKPSPRPRFSRVVRESLNRLIDQQCWCWGRDVLAPPGNLLIERGFLRVRAPSHQPKSSGYFLLTPEYQIGLWGFGVWFTRPDQPALFLSRFDPRPRMLQVDRPPFGVPNRYAFGHYHAPHGPEQWATMTDLFSACCAWIADYETWVTGEHGADYRATTLERWDHPALPPSTMARAWRQLGSTARVPPRAAD